MDVRMVWALAGLALWGIGAYGVWWANYGMTVLHWAAPFLVGTIFTCLFLPLGLACLLFALCLGPRPKDERKQRSKPDYPPIRRFQDFDKK